MKKIFVSLLMLLVLGTVNVSAGEKENIDLNKMMDDIVKAVSAESVKEENKTEDEVTLMDIETNTLIADINGDEYVFEVENALINDKNQIAVIYEADNPRGDKAFRIVMRLEGDIEPADYEVASFDFELTPVTILLFTDYRDGIWKDEYKVDAKNYPFLLSYRDDKWEHYQGAFEAVFTGGYEVENAVFDFRLNVQYGSEKTDGENQGLSDLVNSYK